MDLNDTRVKLVHSVVSSGLLCAVCRVAVKYKAPVNEWCPCVLKWSLDHERLLVLRWTALVSALLMLWPDRHNAALTLCELLWPLTPPPTIPSPVAPSRADLVFPARRSGSAVHPPLLNWKLSSGTPWFPPAFPKLPECDRFKTQSLVSASCEGINNRPAVWFGGFKGGLE